MGRGPGYTVQAGSAKNSLGHPPSGATDQGWDHGQRPGDHGQKPGDHGQRPGAAPTGEPSFDSRSCIPGRCPAWVPGFLRGISESPFIQKSKCPGLALALLWGNLPLPTPQLTTLWAPICQKLLFIAWSTVIPNLIPCVSVKNCKQLLVTEIGNNYGLNKTGVISHKLKKCQCQSQVVQGWCDDSGHQEPRLFCLSAPLAFICGFCLKFASWCKIAAVAPTITCMFHIRSRVWEWEQKGHRQAI